MFLFVRAKDAICGPESGLAIKLPNMTAVSGLYPGKARASHLEMISLKVRQNWLLGLNVVSLENVIKFQVGPHLAVGI